MLSLLAAAAVHAQTTQALTERIVLASMFKNGFAIVVREMKVSGKGEYLLEQIPQASLGTLWFTTSEGLKLLSVKNVLKETSTSMQASSFDELLRLNVGKAVTITTVNLGVITAKIVGINGEMVLLQEDKGITMIPRGEIRKLVLGPEAVTTRAIKGGTRGLALDVEGSGSIFMLSLERGMTWTPGYAVTLKEGKKLQVVGKATVINDLEDLKGIETRFITGFPNIPYAYIADPLTDAAAYQAVLSGMGGPSGGFGGGRGGGMADAMKNQAPAARDFGESMPIADLGGIQAEDLFYYRQPNVSLKKGERAYFIVFVMEAPYDELYTWDVADYVQGEQYRPIQNSDPVEEVWHTIRFTNTSKQPFSTGTATIFRNEEMVGQDMMKYASPGGKAELKITKAMDISAEQLEEEVSRERGALKNTYGTITHDLITLKGTLTMVNRKAEATPVRIRKSLTGEVISATPEGKVTKVARGLRDVNSRSVIEWTQTIPPGKTLTIGYSYKVYIRI